MLQLQQCKIKKFLVKAILLSRLFCKNNDFKTLKGHNNLKSLPFSILNIF